MFAKYRYLQWVSILLFVVVSNSFAGGWKQVTELPIWRMGDAPAVVKGKIYLIGGFDHHKNLGGRAPALSTVDVYDTQMNTWHTAANMPTPRVAPQTAVFSNEIYVLGGYDRKGPRGAFRYTKNVEMYDTLEPIHGSRNGICQRFVRGSPPRSLMERYTLSVDVFTTNRLGEGVATGLVEVYDPLTNRWEKRAGMPTERGETRCCRCRR